MKKLKFVAMLMLSAVMCAGFASCSSDDEDVLPANIIQTLMEYKWVNTYYDETIGDDYIRLYKDVTTFFFLEDGYGIRAISSHIEDSDFGSSNSQYYDEFNYSIDGNIITINGTEYKYSNDKLIDSSNVFIYERKSMTDYDYERIEKAKNQLSNG